LTQAVSEWVPRKEWRKKKNEEEERKKKNMNKNVCH